MIDIPKVVEELKRDEGYRGIVYKCSAGKLTIGYGHNIEVNPIPEAIAEKLLHNDIAETLAQCEKWPWFFALDGVRQRVIINMVFNIGFNGVDRFRNMIAAIEANDYDKAAYEMTNSRWYVQVGARAQRLVKMMEDGE